MKTKTNNSKETKLANAKMKIPKQNKKPTKYHNATALEEVGSGRVEPKHDAD